MKKLMLSLFVALGFSACSLNNDEVNQDCGTNEDMAFTGFPLLCSYTPKTSYTEPSVLLIGSDEKLLTNFTKNENSCPNSSNNTIDFTKESLLALFAGVKPTSGYSIKIATIIENKCEILVNYYEKAPQPGEVVTGGTSYPSDFILIPKTTKPIFFKRVIPETTNNVVIGSFNNQCTGGDCQRFFQISDFNILKFQNVVAGGYDFNQYRYAAAAKKGDYTLFLKDVPAEILNLDGQPKTYGTPNEPNHGGVYFELRQGATVTKVQIDNVDTADQSAEIKAFKKVIQDKITTLK